MKNSHIDIKNIAERPERIYYNGVYNTIADLGDPNRRMGYIKYDRNPCNQYQEPFYKQAMYGLRVYNEKALAKLTIDKQNHIKRINLNTQTQLNLLKQEKIQTFMSKFFSIFNHRSPLAKELIDMYSTPDPKFVCKTRFKALGIDKEQIIKRLLMKRLLPSNFETL